MTAIAHPRHRVAVAIARVQADLDSIADDSVWSMDDGETAATLVALTKASAQVSEITARVAAHADDIHLGRDTGASSAGDWLAHTTKTTRPAAHGTVRLGHALEAHDLTRDALAHGEVLLDQARVIINAVDQLPDDVDADLRGKAEAHLLGLARDYDAKTLRRLGKRLFEVIAPDEADAREAAALEAEEKKAARSCHLKLWDDGQGQTHGSFTVPTLYGAALRKALQAIAAPKHQHATRDADADEGVVRSATPEALGHAFCEYILGYPAADLPKTGGLNATLLVTLDFQVLLGQLEKAGVLDTGEKISPAMCRKLACQAGIIPVVLDGDSQPLDVGRERRLHTTPMRHAMVVRDRGCRAEGCDRTTGLHAHHKIAWADGGDTNLRDAVSLCHWHHNRAHDTAYETTYHPNGDVSFHRRT